MAPGIARLPELDIEHRAELFRALLALRLDEQRVVSVLFGERKGWIVADPETARELLSRRDLPKGRGRSSQQTVGGFVARDGDEFRRRRSEVIAALAHAAGDPEAMRATLSLTIPSWPEDRRLRPAAFTRWMLQDLVGKQSEPVGTGLLTRGIGEAENLAERSQAGSALASRVSSYRSALHDGLKAEVERSSSIFTEDLRERGWSADEIAEELVALALAGWESTAAAVTSGRALGFGSTVSGADIAELLRLYPPSWLIVRELTDETGWGRPGDLAVVSPWLLHRSPAGSVPIPFGAGPRRCPADLYARTQIAVALQTFGGELEAEALPGLLHRRAAALLTPSDRSSGQ